MWVLVEFAIGVRIVQVQRDQRGVLLAVSDVLHPAGAAIDVRRAIAAGVDAKAFAADRVVGGGDDVAQRVRHSNRLTVVVVRAGRAIGVGIENGNCARRIVVDGSRAIGERVDRGGLRRQRDSRDGRTFEWLLLIDLPNSGAL